MVIMDPHVKFRVGSDTRCKRRMYLQPLHPCMVAHHHMIMCMHDIVTMTEVANDIVQFAIAHQDCMMPLGTIAACHEK